MQKLSESRLISFKDFYLAWSHMQKKKKDKITTTPLPISQGIKTKMKKSFRNFKSWNTLIFQGDTLISQVPSSKSGITTASKV